jgi:DNA-binding MarR family transcriptional regulator
MKNTATKTSFPLRDLPRYEELRARVSRYPDLQPHAVEACLILFRVASDGLAAFDVHFARLKITPGRMSVLSILNRDPERSLSPSILAERAGVTRATMTGLLDRLVRDRLIKRTTDRADRRRSSVKLTDKGREFLDRILPDHYRRLAAMMTGLSIDEQRHLTEMLYRISDRIALVSNVETPTLTAGEPPSNNLHDGDETYLPA